MTTLVAIVLKKLRGPMNGQARFYMAHQMCHGRCEHAYYAGIRARKG